MSKRNKLPENMREELVEKVFQQMQYDISSGDLTAIYELFSFIPEENLIGYLPEDESYEFKSVLNHQNNKEKFLNNSSDK